MKAMVYLAETRDGWRPRLTVAWDVDERFWLDPAFGRGVLEGAGVAADDRPLAVARLAVLRLPLPLGVAEAAAAWLAEGGMPGGADVLRRLMRAASVCRAAADARAGRRRADAGAERRRTERAAGSDTANGSPADAVVLVPEDWRPTEEEEVRRDRGRRLGRLARRASALLAGRSLLPEEAQRLFAEELPELMPGEWLAVVQTAHLLGRAELQAGLAPPMPSGRRGRGRPGQGWRAIFPFARDTLRCRRCGGGEKGMLRTPCASCGRICAVCETCLTMGRCRECELLIVGKPAQDETGLRMPARHPDAWLDRWNLSPAQREASAQALAFLWRTLGRTSGGDGGRGSGHGVHATGMLSTRPAARAGGRSSATGERRFAGERRFLLWAVTGAGKTEMLFPLLESVLAAGGRALVATPRRDVVLELAPRLARAFGADALSVRYGGSPDRKSGAPLTLATTHQLLRFQEAFDLVVIDELDAFPYHGDPMLQFAAAKARKADGVTVLLTATPPRALQREVRRGRLPCAKVPVRYHRHPLPEPRRLPLPELARMLRTGRLPRRLLRALRRSVAAGRSLFVFVPYIRQAEALASLLRMHAGALGLEAGRIAGTSSRDPGREAKVQAFRQRDVRLLVATTILERGVTVPRSDVFILDADHAMFDETALVQMAGRAGRSADAPDARVYFGGRSMTASQRRAMRHIRSMNRLARRKGYLLSAPSRQCAPGRWRFSPLFRKAAGRFHLKPPGRLRR